LNEIDYSGYSDQFRSKIAFENPGKLTTQSEAAHSNHSGTSIPRMGPRKINIVLNWFEELKERVPLD